MLMRDFGFQIYKCMVYAPSREDEEKKKIKEKEEKKDKEDKNKDEKREKEKKDDKKSSADKNDVSFYFVTRQYSFQTRIFTGIFEKLEEINQFLAYYKGVMVNVPGGHCTYQNKRTKKTKTLSYMPGVFLETGCIPSA